MLANPQMVSTLDGGGVTTIFTALDRVDVLRTTINNCQLHIPESNALTGDEFRNLTNEERMQKVGTIRILGSCTPQDKVTLLNFLKEKGEVVAVLGLQTNDAPALKEADIGLTMGIRSSEMAKECSDLIIWNADFTFLVNGIKSGRRTYENIRKFIQFQLVNIISSSLVNSIATIFLGDAPMTAMELFWLNLVVALLGGLALLTMPPAENLMKMPPIRTSGRLITNATWRNIAIQVSYQTAICSILLLKGSAVLGISADAIKSMICNSLFLCQLFNKIIAREPEKNNIFERLHQNRWFWVAFVLFLMSQAAMTATENVLGISASLSWKLWALCILIGLVSWPLDFAGKCASDFHTRCLLQIKAGNEGQYSFFC
ncbi:calcium-transporting ATPase 12, plasma membrane-type-like [Olea europaea subsp. europaea]|uniref:Calcium-transporting ATPase 12, plasma membrane-type-like n=1 Tax=Olea europaea subsp. europaea TaxID=158383 RepID=A0A8S0RUV0_OLEEU|nr:calcium-transporting ATPase 12, plasma membrane-type-like [Olea europaea subsp. europaea]